MPSTARSDLAVYEAMRRALKKRFDEEFPPSRDEAMDSVVPPLSKFRWALNADWQDWERTRSAALVCGNG